MKPGHILVSVLVLGLFLVIGCGKNGGKGKPKLSLESVNTTVQHDDSMRALFKVSNAGGLSNGTFFAIRNRLNQLALNPGDSVGIDTFPVGIPSFSANNAEFRFALPAQGFLSESGPHNQNDTLIYQFFVMTQDSVSSDTIKTPQIVVLYQ
jgi:hypothetical protein